MNRALNFPLIYPLEEPIFIPNQQWFCDFSAASWLAPVTNYPGQVMGGVTNWPVRVIRNMPSPGSSDDQPSLGIDPAMSISSFGWGEFTANDITNQTSLLQIAVSDDAAWHLCSCIPMYCEGGMWPTEDRAQTPTPV